MSLSAELCSLALVELGDQPISSLDEATPRARTCRAVYATVRDSLLRQHPWNCATRRVILAPESETPPFDFQYQFLRPSDWLRTMQVGYRARQLRYKSEGRRLLADVDALPLVYVWRNDDESSWDSQLQELLSLAIKARIAYSITKNASERENSIGQYLQSLKIAKAVDGQDDPPEEFQEVGDLTLARRGLLGMR